MRVKVYSGLSVSQKEVRKLLPNAIASGPIRRGDLKTDASRGIKTVLIIDGVSHFREASPKLTVSPSEITAALRAGLRIIGASSIGALRAVELESQGMEGIGRIFEDIRQDVRTRPAWRLHFRDDDLMQTAILDHNGQLSQAGLTWIDLHYFLLKLIDSKNMSKKDYALIRKRFRAIPYYLRNEEQILRAFQRKPELGALTLRLMRQPQHKRQKHKDAVTALKQLKREYKNG